MKRSFRMLPGRVAAVAALMAALGAVAAEGPPKTAADYAKDLEGADRAAKREAAYQLSRMGAGARVALPQLIRALDDDQQQVWFGSITALANLGPDAEAALPALLKELEAWQPFRKDRQGAQSLYRTAQALGAIGTPAVPALSNALSADKWSVRAGAARALGFAGAPARPVVSALVGLLRDERPEVREAASESVAVLGAGAVTSLMEMVTASKEPRGRAAAANTLGRLGTNAVAALPVLRAALETDPEVAVRVEALNSLGRCGLPPGEYLPLLMKVARGSDEALGSVAVRALLLVRPVDAVLMPPLLAELGSTEPARRQFAAGMIGELGPDAGGAAGTLVGLLKATPPGTEPDAALVRALGSLGEPGLRLVLEDLATRGAAAVPAKDWTLSVLRQVNTLGVPVLVGALSHGAAPVRAGALEGLAALGSEGKPAVRRIAGLLDDADVAVRSRAWLAAAACGVNPEALLGRLDGALRDPSVEVRLAAVRSVARLGAAAKPAVPRLITAVETGDADLRWAAVRALASLGPESAPAVETLASRLEKGGAAFQVELLAALGAIGPAAAPAVPRMIPLAGAPTVEVRRAFVEAVGLLRTGGREAAGTLVGALKDEDPSVRGAALGALASVDPESPSTLEAILGALEDPEAAVRREAAAAIGKLEERGRPAEARLFAMLGSESDRGAARDALRAIHPTSVPALVEALKHAEWSIRLMAVDGLSRLGKGAEEAKAALETVMRDDPQEEVKRACRRALRRIREG